MFSVITKIYNKKTKGPTLMELFTATGKRPYKPYTKSNNTTPPTIRSCNCP